MRPFMREIDGERWLSESAVRKAIAAAVAAEREACEKTARDVVRRLCEQGEYTQATGAGDVEAAIHARGVTR